MNKRRMLRINCVQMGFVKHILCFLDFVNVYFLSHSNVYMAYAHGSKLSNKNPYFMREFRFTNLY